ncbi:MAG: chromate transporter [Bacteroidales bacterium]|jgi:chromate transporter|nr:chromate transporter [Bacteroidales bacterium]MDD2263759.1 chromate transporter [Bacteroidales bacterium]MDD2831023.1 chromate transporter [Bacteroidales bacterium]MDD3208169.1 chromate transporter [Bacteroidales bacterium]MDD3696789.1 chromate transporter [Bacteroidales bacterium]
MYWNLFKVFFRIGAFTIGGGLAMLPIIEREVVDRKKWITKEDFTDMLAVTQTLPGIIAVNMAVAVGYRIKGFRGSLISVLGAVLAPFFSILILAVFFRNFRENPVVEKVFMGMRPVVISLIAVPVITTMRSIGLTFSTGLISAAAALLIWLFGISPVWIIMAAGLGGYIWHRIEKHQEGRRGL